MTDWTGNTIDVLLRVMKELYPDWQPDPEKVEAARAYCEELVPTNGKPPEGGSSS